MQIGVSPSCPIISISIKIEEYIVYLGYYSLGNLTNDGTNAIIDGWNFRKADKSGSVLTS